jgi:hypothetical protein
VEHAAEAQPNDDMVDGLIDLSAATKRTLYVQVKFNLALVWRLEPRTRIWFIF